MSGLPDRVWVDRSDDVPFFDPDQLDDDEIALLAEALLALLRKDIHFEQERSGTLDRGRAF